VIVSGSSSFEIKNKFTDSLVGRTVNFEIFPLSFSEFLHFRGEQFMLTHVHTRKKIDELKILYTEFILYGGYPKIVLTSSIEKKERYLQQIIDTYIRKDIRDLADIRDIDKFNRLLEVLAAQSGQLVNVAELSRTAHIAKVTVEKYLFILEQTYIIRLLRPFSKNIRSEVFSMPKIFFYDTGLMQLLWLKQFQKQVLGNVFETSIFSELIKKYQKDQIYFWRTTDKKEIDFILEHNAILLPIEVKWNAQRFRSTAIDYFCERYHISKYRVISMEKEIDLPQFIYPWNFSTPSSPVTPPAHT